MTRPLNIYVASSWRNMMQPGVVAAVRAMGCEVYDFKNPRPGDQGFAWSSIDPNWQAWSAKQTIAAYRHPLAVAGYKSDADALNACDACILVMPCGRSAHLELGWAAGAGKKTCVLLVDGEEPDLMHRLADHVVATFDEMLAVVEEWMQIHGQSVGARRFNCACGAWHERGPLPGGKAYRCMRCGEITPIAEQSR